MNKTNNNLMSAFGGESQANRKYLAFSKKAEQSGKIGLAKLFKAAADGETVHALNHFSVLGEVKDNMDNLKSAIKGETYEIETMYPEFISESKIDKHLEAEVSFVRAEKVEEIHQKLFKEAFKKNGEIEEKEYFVCGVCGYPAIGETPEKCPICGALKEKFNKVIL
jgi:rubrerythrin